MLEYISVFKNFLANINPVFMLFVIFAVGTYIFWRGSAESRKNRSSIFDMFILSGIFSVVVGRVIYIIVEWSEFANFIWYWLPYEKYGDQVFIFRLLPWRFFNVLSGELIIIAMFTALLLFATFYTLVIKRWRWKHLFFPIYFSATTMLGLSFLLTGFVRDVSDWMFKGGILVGGVFVFLVAYAFFVKVISDPRVKKFLIGYLGLIFAWSSSVYIGYIYLTGGFSLIENISVAIFLIWSVLLGIYFIIDLRKASVSIESFSHVRSVGDTNIILK